VRIDPNSLVGGYSGLTIRKLARRLNNLLSWNTETVQVILQIERAEAEAIVDTLVKAGLAVAGQKPGRDQWITTQLAQRFASATAATPIKRRTADRALAELLERVERVNRDERFLAMVTRVILLGSYLQPDIDRLSDLDIAVELQPKEADWDRLREATQARVEQLRMAGRRFGSWPEVEYWWHLEAFRFLKGRSRAISLIDYGAEKEFVNRVPHKVLFSTSSGKDAGLQSRKVKHRARPNRRPGDCAF
jgi:predicted nucleotidyltransferase